jgi:hypothetical protein
MSGFQSKTYEYSGETTEWEDILIRKGIRMKETILEEKGLDFVEHMPEKYGTKEEVVELSAEEMLSNATLEELDAVEEVMDDERAIQEYREARLNALREQRARNRFGLVKDIDKVDWTREVNDASKDNWVIVHMYQDAVVECRLMDEVLTALAQKFKYIKFVRIKSTSAVENWPDRNLPTLFMYNEGEAKDQIMTLNNLGGKSMKSQDLEWALVQKGIITNSELECDPRDVEEVNVNLPRRISSTSRFIKTSRILDDDENDDSDNDL